MLEVRGLESGYKRSIVLQGLDLDLPAGQVLGLLGRNGVGKSTLVHTVMGLVRPSAGSVKVDGVEVAGRRPDVIARAGVALVPQGRRVWAPLTVTETLELAQRRGRGKGPWTIPWVLELLPRLGERTRHGAGQLSGGEQQMLAIGRALLNNPRLVLMDEPSDGLAPAVVDLIGEAVLGMKEECVTLLVVEQDLHLAFTVADEIAVMDKGRIVHPSRRGSSVATARWRTRCSASPSQRLIARPTRPRPARPPPAAPPSTSARSMWYRSPCTSPMERGDPHVCPDVLDRRPVLRGGRDR